MIHCRHWQPNFIDHRAKIVSERLTSRSHGIGVPSFNVSTSQVCVRAFWASLLDVKFLE
jgi:hypothetical protein